MFSFGFYELLVLAAFFGLPLILAVAILVVVLGKKRGEP